MARIKDITFESGSLTGTNGADSAQGAISLDSASAVKGTYSARSTAAGDFVREDFTAVDTVYVSTLIKLTTLPASAQTRVLLVRNVASGLQCSLRITSAGKVQLRDAGNTQVGSDSSTTLSTGTIYRLGIRYTKGTGSNATLEAFVAADGVAFGAAFASTSAATNTVQIDRVEVGQSAGGTASDHFIDNIRVDDASMPTDDVGGGTTYNQSVNATVSSSISILKQVNKPNYFTAVSVATILKQTTHPISIVASNAVLFVKSVNKYLSFTVGNIVPDVVKQANKNINIVVGSVAIVGKEITKTINTSTAANVVIVASLLFFQTVNITVNNAVIIGKTVGKHITLSVNVLVDMLRDVTSFALGFGRNIGVVVMQTKDENTRSLASIDSQIIVIDPNDETTI